MSDKRERNAALEAFEAALTDAYGTFLKTWPKDAPQKVSLDITRQMGELLAVTTFHTEE